MIATIAITNEDLTLGEVSRSRLRCTSPVSILKKEDRCHIELLERQ